MTTLDVAVRLRMLNQLGAGAKSAERDLRGIENAAKRIGGTGFGDRLRQQMRTIGAGAIEATRHIEKMATVAAGVTAGVAAMRKVLGAPAQADADFRDIIIEIGQKAEVSKDKLGGLSAEVKAMADRLKTSPEAIGKGIDVLMGSGLDLDVSKSLIEPIRKVARAYRVETDDVSQAVFSMVKNLRVAPQDVEVALSRMSQAAADGRFEIKNFAADLPELAALYQRHGQTGLAGISRLSAAAETVAGVVGTPGQATPALRDMLNKATSDEVLKDFKKRGVKNIEKQLAAARKSGADIVPIISVALQKATKGDAGFISKIFGDVQAQNAAGVLGTKEGLEAYLKLRDKYEKIVNANKLNSDLDMRKEGAGDTFRTFSDRFQAFLTSVGGGVNVYLSPFVAGMERLLDIVTKLTDAFPKLTGAVTLFGAALAGGAAFTAVTSIMKRLGAGGAAAAAGAAASGGSAATAATAGTTGLAAGLGLRGIIGRLGAAGAGAYVGLKLIEGIETIRNSMRTWNVGSREEGAERLRELTEQRQQLKGKIAEIYGKSKMPEMADTLAAPLKTQLGDVENEINAIVESMKKLDMVRPHPQINTSSLDEALGKARALQNVLSSSFSTNAAPAGTSAVAGGQKQANISQRNTFQISGYDPGVVARRVVRAQDREIARSQARALHDLGELA